MISEDDYTAALKVVKEYREERDMEFYIPINISGQETIMLEEFKLYLALQKL